MVHIAYARHEELLKIITALIKSCNCKKTHTYISIVIIIIITTVTIIIIIVIIILTFLIELCKLKANGLFLRLFPLYHWRHNEDLIIFLLCYLFAPFS